MTASCYERGILIYRQKTEAGVIIGAGNDPTNAENLIFKDEDLRRRFRPWRGDEPAKRPQSSTPICNVEPVQNLVLPVTARPDIDVIDIEGALSPGMAETAEIRTGKRRIFEYLISPLTEVASEAMRLGDPRLIGR